jgi:acyl-CoA thioester hydrolase
VSNRGMPEALSVDVPLRWSDMDAYGHVNNVQFLRLLEDARVVALGAWFDGQELLDRGVIVSRHEIEYLAPLVFRPAPVRITLWPSAVSTAGFDVGYEIADPPAVGSRVYARAETGLVAYDLGQARPRRLDPGETQRLTELLGAPVSFRWRRR